MDGFLVLLLLELSLKFGDELITLTQLGLQVGDFTSGVVLCSAEQVGQLCTILDVLLQHLVLVLELDNSGLLLQLDLPLIVAQSFDLDHFLML